MMFTGVHTDQELLWRLVNDDRKAFSVIYDRYKEVLYRHAYRMLRDEEEVKDILQELFANLWNRRFDLPHTDNLSSYLYKAVRNRVLDRIAHRKVEERYLSSLADFLEAGVCMTDELVREKELAQLIEKEVSKLPPRMREVFELSRRDNLSYKEIAEVLQISDKTVKKQVSNALTFLKGKIDLVVLWGCCLKCIFS